MRKITKTLIAILLIAILSMTSITSFASTEAITPRLSHTNYTNLSFSATANGGNIYVTYLGNDSFAQAELTVKIEKQFLFFFWTEVDTWSAIHSDTSGQFLHTFTLTGSGTYKATFTLKVAGKDGTVDTITKSIESSY